MKHIVALIFRILKRLVLEILFLQSFRRLIAAIFRLYTQRVLQAKKFNHFTLVEWIKLLSMSVFLSVFSFVVIILLVSTYKVLALEYLPPTIYFAGCYLLYGKATAELMVAGQYNAAADVMNKITVRAAELTTAASASASVSTTNWTALIASAIIAVTVMSGVFLWKAHCANTVTHKILTAVDSDHVVKARLDDFETNLRLAHKQSSKEARINFENSLIQDLDVDQSAPHSGTDAYSVWYDQKTYEIMDIVEKMEVQQNKDAITVVAGLMSELNYLPVKCLPAYGGRVDFRSHNISSMEYGITFDSGVAAVEAINASIDKAVASLDGLEKIFYLSESAITGVAAKLSSQDSVHITDNHIYRDLLSMGLSVLLGVGTFFGAGLVIKHVPIAPITGLFSSLNVGAAVGQTDAYIGLANKAVLSGVYDYCVPPTVWVLKQVNKLINVQSYIDYLLTLTRSNSVTALKTALSSNSDLISQPYEKIVKGLVDQKNANTIPSIPK